jgi:hypothetical protein
MNYFLKKFEENKVGIVKIKSFVESLLRLKILTLEEFISIDSNLPDLYEYWWDDMDYDTRDYDKEWEDMYENNGMDLEKETHRDRKIRKRKSFKNQDEKIR